LARSAGSFIKILNRFPNKYNKVLIQLKSGEQYLINRNCGSTIGIASNINNWLRNWKKANMSKKLGFRSAVRGIAMNPVDHPHGGRTNGGCPSVTPSGIITKGKKTRKKQISKNVIFKRASK
jgi:large subunit ribosomal protein L2